MNVFMVQFKRESEFDEWFYGKFNRLLKPNRVFVSRVDATAYASRMLERLGRGIEKYAAYHWSDLSDEMTRVTIRKFSIYVGGNLLGSMELETLHLQERGNGRD